MFVHTTKTHQFKAKDSEIKPYLLHLGNISKDFAVNNMKKNRIKWVCARSFCGDNIIDNNNISIYKYFMKKKRCKIMHGFIKKKYILDYG